MQGLKAGDVAAEGSELTWDALFLWSDQHVAGHCPLCVRRPAQGVQPFELR